MPQWGFASDHRVELVVHRNLYPTRPVSDPHFRLRRWKAALGPLMLTVPVGEGVNGVSVNSSTVSVLRIRKKATYLSKKNTA